MVWGQYWKTSKKNTTDLGYNELSLRDTSAIDLYILLYQFICPWGTSFSALLSMTLVRASTSNITTLLVTGCNIDFQKSKLFWEIRHYLILKNASPYSFKQLCKFKAWNKITVKAVHFESEATFCSLGTFTELRNDKVKI